MYLNWLWSVVFVTSVIVSSDFEVKKDLWAFEAGINVVSLWISVF